MKKLFIVIPMAALVLAACSGNNSKENNPENGTHQHEDGSVHQNHEEEKAKQEEFSVSADTLNKPAHKEHTHDGHEKPHNH